uniref:Uncharacterized protein n=1 Tax=Anguilla anguilla TaxID=7936 RepID=A0A0E9V3Y1_ANGAN
MEVFLLFFFFLRTNRRVSLNQVTSE